MSKRSTILKLAHEFSGHGGCKRMKVIIGTKFTWPNIAKDGELHVKSCITCANVNKGSRVPTPMIEHPVISQPFEVIAVDTVGPLPPGMGGMRSYLLHVVWLPGGLMLCL